MQQPESAEHRPGPDAIDISYVIPIYNESETLPLLFDALRATLDRIAPRYRVEVLLVDDGSRDDTWQQIEAGAARDPRFCGVRLSRNFGHQAALTCGYHCARGRAVICLDADLQDPPETTLRMIEAWEQGADVVFAVRSTRPGETWLKLATARGFYWLIERLGGIRAPRNAGDFRLLSRRALAALNALPEHHRYIRGLVGWLGFQTATITYERHERVAGVTKYPFRKMLRFAMDAIVSMSFAPLRMAYTMAIVAAVPFVLFLFYGLIRWLVFNEQFAKGWASLILAVIVFGTTTLIFIGIMGEYVGRIYEEVKNRPLFLISDRTSSKEKE